MPDRTLQAGRLLAHAWKSGALLPDLGKLRPSSRQEAYAVQGAMSRALGLPVAGWKVGAATPAIMAVRQLDAPVSGPVYQPRAHSSPAVLPASDFPSANIETEFAFRTTGPLPARRAPCDALEVKASVTAHAAFDLTQSRFSKPPDPLSEIADSGNSGGAVIGPQIPGWRDTDLTSAGVTLRLDGGPPVQTYRGRWRRDPLDVLVWLLNSLGRRGIGLAAGSFILTGSLTEPQPLVPGTCASAVFEGARAVELRACLRDTDD
ncbi:MAG: hypothetical protein OXN97_16655 [Bryobacterales bacterium]|nr:hypothetical protein [Bryobacterales bacterium]